MAKDVVVVGLVVLASGCTAPTRQASPKPELPAAYSYVLTSSCGERSLLGRYRVQVRDGAVRTAKALSRGTPRPEALGVPTLQDLLDKAEAAEPDAVVELEVDGRGLPSSLRIDHLPGAIDDEECYTVSDVRVLR